MNFSPLANPSPATSRKQKEKELIGTGLAGSTGPRVDLSAKLIPGTSRLH